MVAESILPPVPVAGKPTTRPRSTLNLSMIGKTQPGEEKLSVESEEKYITRKLSMQEVQQAWQAFAESRKGQVAEFNLLSHDYELHNHTVTLQLTNPVEEPLLAGLKPDLTTFLKEQLKAMIVIEGKLAEHQTKRIIYTNKEKFDHLATKYPYLLVLKDRLGLDTDY